MNRRYLKIATAIYVMPYFVIWSAWIMTGFAFDTEKAFTSDLFMAFAIFTYAIFGYASFHYLMHKVRNRKQCNCDSKS